VKQIVTLGNVGAKIGDSFKEYPQYKIYKMGTTLPKNKSTFVLPALKTPEEYDSLTLDFKSFFRGLKGEVLFVVCPSSAESAACLKILQALYKKGCTVTILYVIPERVFLSEAERLNERVVFHVLQEYTRSGVFERLYFVCNELLSSYPVSDGLNIVNYYDKINEFIVSTFHMINVFHHTEPVLKDVSDVRDISRIATVGFSSLDAPEAEEQPFFLLDNVGEKSYYIAMNENEISGSGTLNKVKTYMTKNNVGKKINYSVHTTDYEQSYMYFISFSSQIQKIA